MGIQYSKNSRIAKLSSKLIHTKVMNALESNFGNIFNEGSKEYKTFGRLQRSYTIKKMIEAGDTNPYEPGSKEYRTYEYLIKKHNDHSSKKAI